MKGFVMTEREQEIIRSLLAPLGITEYDVVVYANSGYDLPESSYSGEISSFEGFIVTAEKIYSFWLDWVDGHYTLGQEEELWEEVELETILPEVTRTYIQRVQQRFRRSLP